MGWDGDVNGGGTPRCLCTYVRMYVCRCVLVGVVRFMVSFFRWERERAEEFFGREGEEGL